MSVNCYNLLTTLGSSDQQYDLQKIVRAFEYAKEMHSGQYRKSGEEFISHPLAVAEIVASLNLDTDSICAALLHDAVEDRPDKANVEDIKQNSVLLLQNWLTGLQSSLLSDLRTKKKSIWKI